MVWQGEAAVSQVLELLPVVATNHFRLDNANSATGKPATEASTL